MSSTVDVNVLLYASDTASDAHDDAIAFLEQWATEGDVVYLFWPTLTAYLRISTHPSIFDAPLAPDDAMQNVGSLLDRPHVRTPGEAEGFWSAYRAVTEGVVVRGNLAPDAHLVALMRQNGVDTVWTRDRDYLKFDGIRVRDPFAA